MNFWLLKTEPSTFSWNDLVHDGVTIWDGVRNYQARNNLKLMKIGDKALIYHSVSEKAVVGIAVVSKEYFADPTSGDNQWFAVEIKPETQLKKSISLVEIKSNSKLTNIALIKQSRLSVLPLEKSKFDAIVSMSNE